MRTPYKTLYYFGDSLTDAGNLFDLVRFWLPFLPEYDVFGPKGAVTNSDTHATYTGRIDGDTVENYAVASARAVGEQTPLPLSSFDINLGAQIARFQADTGGTVDKGAAAVLFVGSNDFNELLRGIDIETTTPEALETAVQSGIAAVLDQVTETTLTLLEAEVKTVYLGTLPASSFYPSFDGSDLASRIAADDAVMAYNEALIAQGEALKSAGFRVEVLDYAALAHAVTEDPSGFGIRADRQDYLINGSIFDSDQVGFWDGLHPAEAIHQAWGAYANLIMAGGTTTTLPDLGGEAIEDGRANVVFAGGGDDVVRLNGGDDVGFGGTGSDDMRGSAGRDLLSGGRGNDLLLGQRDEDVVNGGAGDDIIRGGRDDDILLDGLGNDQVYGGRGEDAFVFVQTTLEGANTTFNDVFRGGPGHDTLYLVLDDQTFASFDAENPDLSALGVTTNKIENIVAVNGRADLINVLGDNPLFEGGDLWGLLPAPSDTPVA